MLKMTIRQATVDDFEIISKLSTQLTNIHIEKRNDIFKAAPKITKKDFEKALKKNLFYISVIENDGDFIGFCKWRVCRCIKNDTLSDRTFSVIDELFICDSYRHNGYGKLLFNKVTEFAKEKGATAVELYVWEFNDGAQKFYKSLGMIPQRTLLEKKI